MKLIALCLMMSMLCLVGCGQSGKLYLVEPAKQETKIAQSEDDPA